MSRHTAGQWCARVVRPGEGRKCTSERPDFLHTASLSKPMCKTASAWLLDGGQAAGTCPDWCNKRSPVSLSYSSCTLSCLCRSLSARRWSPLQTTMAKVTVRVLRMACSHRSQAERGSRWHPTAHQRRPCRTLSTMQQVCSVQMQARADAAYTAVPPVRPTSRARPFCWGLSCSLTLSMIAGCSLSPTTLSHFLVAFLQQITRLSAQELLL